MKPDGFRWVRVGEWLRPNDAFFFESQNAWTPRWDAHVSNYTLRPAKCTVSKHYIRSSPMKNHPTPKRPAGGRKMP